MKRIIAAVIAVLVLCSLMLTACSPDSAGNATPDSALTAGDIEKAILEEAKAFASKDPKKINALLLGSSDIPTGDDPLQELVTLTVFEGVGINALSQLFAKVKIEVIEVKESSVMYNITYPDMTSFFEKNADDIKKTKKDSEVTALINDFASDAKELSRELTLSFALGTDSKDAGDNNGVYVNYKTREFADAMTGGLVSIYERDFEAEVSTAIAETRGYPVATAFASSKDIDSATTKFRIPKFIDKKGDLEDINKEIWEQYHDKIYNAEASPSGEVTTSVTYAWGEKDDVLSLVITQEISFETKFYNVYNISKKTGKRLDNNEVIKATGYSQEEFAEKLLSAVETKFFENLETESLKNNDKNFVDSVNFVLDRTRNDTDLAARSVPYFNDKGELIVITEVPSLAGSDYYIYPLNLDNFTPSPFVGKNFEYKA